MIFLKMCRRFMAIATVMVTMNAQAVKAQTDKAPNPKPAAQQANILDRLNAMTGGAKGAWSDEQIRIMERLRDRAMESDYAYGELRHLTDNIGPRLSGSLEAQKAVEWVADEMRKLGADVTLEKVQVPHWVRGVEKAELMEWPGQARGTTQKIVLTALGGSVATPAEGITADVVAVNDWKELRALPAGAVKGKILLFNHPFDKELAATGHGLQAYGGSVVYRAAGPVAGAMAGAVAVLVRSAGGGDYRSPHTGATDYAPGVTKIPGAAVTAEDSELLKTLTGEGRVTMHLTLTPQTLPDAEGYNVIADWKGTTHPEQVAIVSGHLDSWDLGTGAIDDGAGVAVSMAALELMKELRIRPRRTVRMVAWMSEEENSQGAAQYLKDHATEIGNHVGAIESDLGADHPTGIYYTGKPELGVWLRPVAQVLDANGAGSLVNAPETGEDISGLTAKGVPSFAPIQDSRFYFNYHHSAADTFDKVDKKHLNENAAVVAVLAYALADAP